MIFRLHSRDVHVRLAGRESPFVRHRRSGFACRAGPGRLEKITNKFASDFSARSATWSFTSRESTKNAPTCAFPCSISRTARTSSIPNTSFIHGMYWHVGETADRAIANGNVQPLIIVGIYNTDKRLNEYTPTRDKKLGGGRADKYGSMLTKELKPFIESNVSRAH